jgi:hypothetical protein
MADIAFCAGKKVVDAQNVMTFRDQSVAKMRTEKTGPSGNQYLFLSQ